MKAKDLFRYACIFQILVLFVPVLCLLLEQFGMINHDSFMSLFPVFVINNCAAFGLTFIFSMLAYLD